MSIDFGESVAVITGAGSGVGAATAKSLAARGARVVVTDIDAERAEIVAGEIGEAAVGARCDVTNTEDLEAARDLALERFGHIDMVMNNVGVLAVGPVEDIPLEGWQRVIDINLLGIVRSNLVFLPGLIAQGSGHVVNTASTAGLLPYGYDRLPYTATKHAVVGLSEALYLYLRPKGIGVSCLCPAGVKSNIREQMTFYGTATMPKGPAFQINEAAAVGEMVVEGVAADRFLILTSDGVSDEMRRHGEDVDAYLADAAADVTAADAPG